MEWSISTMCNMNQNTACRMVDMATKPESQVPTFRVHYRAGLKNWYDRAQHQFSWRGRTGCATVFPVRTSVSMLGIHSW